MAILGYFFNAVESGGEYDRVYNAEDFTAYLENLVGNGVFPNPSTQLQVRAGTDMNVIVGAGHGWINGHKMVNTADLTLAIDSSDVLLNRIDDIIFYVDYSTREMGVEVKKGTPASTPTAPSLTRTTTRYEMCLAQISIPKQITAITTALITDTRGNSNLCGFVQGLIQQMDSTTLFAQWQAQFEAWFEAAKAEFQQGKVFKKIEGIYNTQTSNENTFNVLNYVPQYSYLYDILEVYVNGIHLNGNQYTLRNSTVVLASPVATGTNITFEVYKSVSDD